MRYEIFIRMMKYDRYILCALWGALLLMVGTLAFQVHESGVEGRRMRKEKAEVALKSAAELWVNREFDKLGIPYSSKGGGSTMNSKKRRMVLAKEEIAVEVDSVKEAKRLFTSYVLGVKAGALFLLGTPAVDILNELWQKDVNSIQSDCFGALILQSYLPGEKKGERFLVGDSTLMLEKYKLGTYYLDNMYFLELTAYLAIPSPWLCANWGENGIAVCFVMVAFILFALILFFLRNRIKRNSNDTNSSDDIVVCISEKKYKIGGLVFDEEACTLTFEDKGRVDCPKQSYKILSAFIHAEKHFLTNDRIVEVCGWNPNERGVDVRKRMAVSQLRKLLDSEKSHVKLESGENEKKERGVSLIIEE